jgi:hypothetical protein
MHFEDYFGFRKLMPQRQLIISFIAGLAPKPFALQCLRLREIAMKQGACLKAVRRR